MSISLARLEDYSDLTSSRVFLCCNVDIRDNIYECEEVMAVTVPPQFTRVKKILGIDGNLKRVFAPKAMVYSFDVRQDEALA